jgi:rubredoxin
MQMHMTSHVEAKIFHTCDVCNWTFEDSLQLENHKIAAGHLSAPADYKCDNINCLKGFASAAELRR